jgi:hypothetical protein
MSSDNIKTTIKMNKSMKFTSFNKNKVTMLSKTDKVGLKS